VQTDAADIALFFDNGDPFAELGGLYGAPLAAGTAADTDQIVVIGHRVIVPS